MLCFTDFAMPAPLPAHRFGSQLGSQLGPLLTLLAVLAPVLGSAACGEAEAPPCETARAPSRASLGCLAAFQAQAARPLSTALPGAYTVKTMIDQADSDRVHFQDTTAYPLHRAFAVAQLGYPRDQPFVDEYFLPERRLLLGAITHYEDADLWAYELAPYDTATTAQVAKALRLLRALTFLGDRLRVHPGSREQEARFADLPADVPTLTTDEIYRGLRYQAHRPGTTLGRLRRLPAAELSAAAVGPTEIVVLDHAPQDLPVGAGVVTEDFQTPLSHVNVLSQQRMTPNMTLRDARSLLASSEGQWVRLAVGAFDYQLTPATQAEAEAFWAARRPGPTAVPAPDYARAGLPALDELRLADVGAVGGKAAHFGELRRIAGVRARAGFAIPVRYYRQFMTDHGFDAALLALRAEPRFAAEPAYRQSALLALQARMLAAPLSPPFLQMVLERIASDMPGVRVRFRSSTNAEDLQGHSGAGLYDAASGQPGDAQRPVEQAIKKVWASLWGFRAFEERSWVRIDPDGVAMGVLVHPAYQGELAGGVAVTANPFDPTGYGDDAFYVNAQAGEESAASPPPGVTADQLLFFYYHNGQPAAYFARSSLVAPPATVLSRAQLFDLGQQLDAIRAHFAPLAMDVEFKLVADRDQAVIEIEQARPSPARNKE